MTTPTDDRYNGFPTQPVRPVPWVELFAVALLVIGGALGIVTGWIAAGTSGVLGVLAVECVALGIVLGFGGTPDG